jgi:hypothetical protein
MMPLIPDCTAQCQGEINNATVITSGAVRMPDVFALPRVLDDGAVGTWQRHSLVPLSRESVGTKSR